jgi:AraC-like DNA-binding protein
MINSFNIELEKLDGFETDYVKLLYYDLPENYEGTYRTFGYSRFCTILSGEKNINAEGRNFTYNKSKSLLLPSYSKVNMKISKPTKAMVFELNDSMVKEVARKSGVEFDLNDDGKIKKLLVNNLTNNINEDLKHFTIINKSKSKKDVFLIDLYAQKLIFDLLNSDVAANLVANSNEIDIKKAVDYIENNLLNPIYIKDIANYMMMSESNFSHAFKKYSGMSPQKFINKKKMEKAEKLLCKNSVTETSYELGYENISYFIKLFKTSHGVTPKQYQLMNPNY